MHQFRIGVFAQKSLARTRVRERFFKRRDGIRQNREIEFRFGRRGERSGQMTARRKAPNAKFFDAILGANRHHRVQCVFERRRMQRFGITRVRNAIFEHPRIEAARVQPRADFVSFVARRQSPVTAAGQNQNANSVGIGRQKRREPRARFKIQGIHGNYSDEKGKLRLCFAQSKSFPLRCSWDCC